jgi:hypothetical protein
MGRRAVHLEDLSVEAQRVGEIERRIESERALVLAAVIAIGGKQADVGAAPADALP